MMPCPNDDTLGALVQRSLDATETERVTSHLDECADCRQIIVAAVRSGSARLAIGTPADAGTARKPATIGTRIGRYELRTLIGTGGMGHVYEAYDGELDRAIALKVLRPELAGSAVVLAERLVRESRLMAKVVHPAVITVHDVGRAGDAVFIAMELIRGETLGSYVADTRRSWREIVELYERAGQGLCAAHAAGIVHRDFKPDNVLIETATKRVVVTDFGIARALVQAGDVESAATGGLGDVSLTATGVAVGTPAYMAPEQLAATGVVDVRADVFAFSVSLWESLFGERPFPGKTVAEIRAAMNTPPRPTRPGVPRHLVRVLERGLAIDPRDRWPDLHAMTMALTAARSRRRRVQLAVSATGFLGLGLLGALEVLRPAVTVDPCERGGDSLANVYHAHRTIELSGALGSDPKARAEVIAKLDGVSRAWRDTHRATCRTERQPIQIPTTTACLDARRLELAGYVDDVLADGPTHAVQLLRTIGDPSACKDPAPSLSSANIPGDSQLRRKVTAVRYRAYDAELARDRADFAAALAAEMTIVADARALWPRLHAEALFLLGSTQSQGADAKQAAQSFREAAAIAQAAHHDHVAAYSWIELMASATFDDGDPARGLEYLAHAEAATDRLGRPAKLETLLQYVKGTTLIEANRIKEAEVALHRAALLAETAMPDYLPQAHQGLGYLYERKGAYVDAVAAYRRAIKYNAEQGFADTANEAVFRTRVAINLALIGNGDEAELEARKAVEISDRVFGLEHTDRAIAHTTLAHVLHTSGKPEAALAVAQGSLRDLAQHQGERSMRYAEALRLEGEILETLRRYAAAEKSLARACDIIAFESGDDSTALAQCWMSHSAALSGLGRKADALALIEKALPLLVTAFDQNHPLVANALATRGALHADLQHHALAVESLERAIAILDDVAFDPGLLGFAQWRLGKELWPRERERARGLIDASIKHLAAAPPTWKATHAEASAWLASDGKPKRR